MAKVVIVEDEQNLLELLELVLKGQGYEVSAASNGREALGIIEQEHPQLVITDIMMPVMDGYELLSRIRSRAEWSKIKVILISAAPIQEDWRQRADGYIVKPYDVETIEQMVNEMIAA